MSNFLILYEKNRVVMNEVDRIIKKVIAIFAGDIEGTR
jgi:hypothetical protein